MRRIRIAILSLILAGAAASIGLTGGAPGTDTKPTTISVTILGAYSLTVSAGNYDYGTLNAWETAPQSKTVTLHATCNVVTYTINIKADGPIQMGGLPATDITLANFHYTGTLGDKALTLTDAPFFTGTRTAGRDHSAELRLINLAGSESAGTYTTTVTFTMVAP